MRIPAPPVPADATIFKFSGGLRGLMLVCAAFYLGFAVFMIAWLLSDPRQPARFLAIVLPGIPFFASMGVWALRRYGRFRDSVAVNSEGLWYLWRKAEPTFLAWRDVAHVEAHDTAQCLALVDARDGTRIRIKYQIDNLVKLREFVLSHVPQAARVPAVLPSVFHRTWINKCVLLAFTAVFLFLASQAGSQDQNGAALGLMGFVALGLVGVARDPSLVTITNNGIVIKYPGWKRTLPFDSIKGIVLTNLYTQDDVWATVLIERKRGKPIKLLRFREGSTTLRDALHSAWVSAGGRDEVAPA